MKNLTTSSTRFIALTAPLFFAVTSHASPFVRDIAPNALTPNATAKTVSKVAATIPVVKKTLANGLTVLVQENHAAPVVAVRMYVRTGSIYEGEYLGAGISHLFEHALSEGTSTRTKEQVNEDVQGIGGQSNAYTSFDVTAYHITTAAPYFARAVDSLSDMMQNATFPDAEVKTQIGVIHNEMNLGADDPDRVLGMLFNETAFRVHPARYPIIGYRAQFDAITRDDIVNYYKTHYTPENTVVSIAGDVKAADVLAYVEKQMGEWPRRNAQTPVLPDEPTQSSPRRASVEKDVSQTQMQIGWHTIPLQHPDLYALDMLAEIMGGSESSRLVRNLRERGLVTSIGAFSSTPNYNAGIFGIRATLKPADAAKVEAAIWNEIAKIKRNGVTTDEIRRAARGVETSFVFGNSGVENQAEQIAYDEMNTGDPEYSKRYVARMQAVTAAQVRAAANKYLARDGVTVASVVPRGSTKTVVATAAKIDASAPQLFTLPNGVRLIIRENHATPTVAITATALGGARLEASSKAGVSALMSELLTRGTTGRSETQISTLVDELGGSIDGFSGYNSWGINSKWLSRDWRSGLALVQESLLSPTFPADQLGLARARQIAGIREQSDDPMSVASLALRHEMYGAHPYGRSSLGSEAIVQKLSRADLIGFHNAVLQPRNLVIAVYGDIDANEIRRAVEYSFGNFRAEAKAPKAPIAALALTKNVSQVVSKPGIAQVVQWYGFPSIDVKGKDRYAIDVLDAAMSGANLPGGRLHARLRDNQLVYVVHAFDQPGLDQGIFAIYAATTPPNSDRVRSIIREELDKVADSGISAAELERAKTMMISSDAIENQDNLSQAQGAASDELYGLGFRNNEEFASRINAITLADVQRVARQYLGSEKPYASATVQPTS